MKKINLLMITPYYAPAWGYGGPPRINYDLARYLAKEGNVTVLTTDALNGESRAKPLREEMEGVKVVRFKNISNWLAWNFKLFFPLGYAAYLHKNIAQYDFVFLSDLRDWQNVFAYKLCRKHDIPYSIAAYGELPLTGGFKGFVKKFYDHFWGRQMISGATYLLGQTDHENKEYLRFGGSESQIELLPLGINYSDYRDASADKSFWKTHGIREDKKIILFIGRINYLKGIDVLIAAMPALLERVPNAHLVIVGRDDGYYLEEIKRQIKDSGMSVNITLVGPLYGRDNYQAYLAASVFAFTPRHYEETSLACLAALALGTPVVTTEQASIPYLEKYQAGFEIPFDQQVLVDKLTIILKNPKLGREMGLSGIELIQNVFDLTQVGKRLEDLIKKAVDDGR
ncbi:MAG: glycosyltransferase [Patescibacteria group bacterium]|jgi:glycosyltransferase involved in cell wall biosynthesis